MKQPTADYLILNRKDDTMSYEGYVQFLCENGHYHTREDDDFSYDPEKEKVICNGQDIYSKELGICHAAMAWSNSVDETNCDGVGYVPMESLLIQAEETQVCNLNHSHVISEAVYRIPTKEETKALQTYRKQDSEGTLITCVGNQKVGTMHRVHPPRRARWSKE